MKSTGYLDFPSKMNEFGKFVFLRTYSRWLEDEKRRETFYEMAQRVAKYNVSLDTTLDTDDKEVQNIVDAMMRLEVFPAGRSMWIGGTKAAEITKLANFNCSFKVIDSLESFAEGFYLLLCGAGFGFRVLFNDVKKLPTLNTKTVLANKPYNPKEKWERREDTVYFDDEDDTAKSRLIVVGDSKLGWVDALRFYLDAMSGEYESIIINYDSVRPKGELLKTFGGRASGHKALRDMFRKIHTVITKETVGTLAPINAMDIMNIIGEGVVVGGVRRTAEICLFDATDEEILNAKVGLFEQGHKNYGKYHRFMSNNSIYFEEKPTKEFLLNVMDRVRVSAEPGFINAAAGKVRRPNFNGVNPLVA